MSDGTLVNFVSGTAGGIAQVLVGHPFDTLKVRLQTQNGQYKGAIDCLVKTVRHEKIYGLYKGVTSPILGVGFCNAIVFTANGFFRKVLSKGGDSTSNLLSLERVALAGGLSGGVMAFVNCPVELLKVRLQIQDPSRPKLYRNIFDCAQQTVGKQGVSGLYRGLTATLLRDIPSFAAYFGIYEALKQLLHDPDPFRNTLNLIIAGGCAGIAAWIPCYPQDMIKSRMQTQNYKSMLDCIKSIFKEAGYKGFFRGFAPTMARAFPANAATFFAYELVSRELRSV